MPKLVGGPTPARVTPKCLILNRRSVVKPGAIQTLQAELSTNEIDLRFTSETWLHDGFDINLVRLAGYTFLTKNGKDRIGGGVEIVCRNDWMMKKIDFKEKDFECLRVRITHKDDQQLYAAVLYHLPNPVHNPDDLIKFLEDTCETILSRNPDARLVLAGDINKLNRQLWLLIFRVENIDVLRRSEPSSGFLYGEP